jgi:hypothetical protein
MSEAKSGVGVSFVPGCRFAHPGYVLKSMLQPGWINLKASSNSHKQKPGRKFGRV